MSNKSEATWDPNSGPEVPHADLIAELRGMSDVDMNLVVHPSVIREAADALAALGTVSPSEPLERYDEHGRAFVTSTRTDWEIIERERDEARAERDALARVIEQAPHTQGCDYYEWHRRPCSCWKSTAPAVSLALHDAVVWDQGYQSGFERGVLVQAKQASGEGPRNPYRAAAVREEAK